MNGRNRYPFTATQWQELENQALIFKYMASGMPIPPDLIFTIKTSLPSSRLFPHQHVGWNCFQMGYGRKVDPEPGRCRRTDGKKWRCSKEAYPDSKYCERHMHRGRNRSRKPVEEVTSATTISTSTTPSSLHKPTSTSSTSTSTSTSSYSLLSSITSEYSTNNTNHHPFLYPHSTSSRPPGIGFLPQDNTAHLLSDRDFRYAQGLKEEVDEHSFLSETSGSMRIFSGGSIDDPWQLTPLKMGFSLDPSKQRNSSVLQNTSYSHLQLHPSNEHTKDHNNNNNNNHCYVWGSDFNSLKIEREDEPQKTVHRFFDEWPPENRDSWIDSNDRSSNRASISTTQLSISIPNSSQEFPFFNSRTYSDG